MAVEGTFIAEQKGAACRGRGRPPRPEDNVEKEWKGMEKLTEQNRAEVEAYICRTGIQCICARRP